MSNCTMCLKVVVIILFLVCFSFDQTNCFQGNKHGTNYSENKKWQAPALSDNQSESNGKQEEDNDSHYYGEKTKLTHASQTFYNKSMLPDESIENFGYLKNVSQNHVLVNVVYDMGNYLSGHNSELSTIKDGNNSQKVEPDLETPLFNKKGENSTSDLDVSTKNALEASDEQTTTSSTEKFESSTTKQDSVAVSSTRNYKDQFTEKDDQKTQIDNNNTMETKITTTQENHTSRSSADTISTMKDASVVSSNVIKSSTDVTAITNDVVKKATDQAQDHSDSSPYRTTVLAAEEKRHEIFEKESDKELTRFDCFVAPDEPLTDFTTKRMEDHETNSSTTLSGPGSLDDKPRFTVKPSSVCTCQIIKEKDLHSKKKSIKEGVRPVKEFPYHRANQKYRSNGRKLLEISWKLFIFVCILLKIVL